VHNLWNEVNINYLHELTLDTKTTISKFKFFVSRIQFAQITYVGADYDNRSISYVLIEMALVKKKLIVKNKQGLHARPAALFVQVANKFDSRITVKRDKEEVNGKSIMGILMLGAEKGSEIVIEAEGSDAHLAMVELEQIVVSEQ